MEITPSTRKDKRFLATFKNGVKIHFGSNGQAYIDHGDEIKKKNYIKRHQVNEEWTKINPGSLSRFILWGPYTDINKNIKYYKNKFNI